ncbi:MAG: CbiQ family ECF transporter T component [Thermoplasmata archaeon]
MHSYIEKTLMELSNYFRTVYYSNDFSSRNGFIQSMNKGVSSFLIISFVVFSLFIHDFIFLLILLSLSIILIILSKIPIIFYFRSLIFIPFFTFIISIPYIFYPFSPTPYLIRFPYLNTGITIQGLYFTAIFLLRVTTAVSFIILLTYGVGFQNFIKSLKLVRFPDIFLNILSFTYRYIFLIATQVYDILLSRKSKMCNEKIKVGKKWQSNLLGHIFFKSQVIGENIYFSMISKGYTGENIKNNAKFKLSYFDFLFITIFLVLIIYKFYFRW